MVDVIAEMFPNAECELVHDNAFELTIAVLLSAQTTDISVNKLTKPLFEKYKTPEDYLSVDISELENDIRTIGLYRNKAKNIQKLSQSLLDKFDGKIPQTHTELESLAGVGRNGQRCYERSFWRTFISCRYTCRTYFKTFRYMSMER